MARLLKDGEVVKELPLQYAGESSTFTTQMKLDAEGSYRLEVLAMDAPNANFGLHSKEIGVKP